MCRRMCLTIGGMLEDEVCGTGGVNPDRDVCRTRHAVRREMGWAVSLESVLPRDPFRASRVSRRRETDAALGGGGPATATRDAERARLEATARVGAGARAAEPCAELDATRSARCPLCVPLQRQGVKTTRYFSFAYHTFMHRTCTVVV